MDSTDIPESPAVARLIHDFHTRLHAAGKKLHAAGKKMTQQEYVDIWSANLTASAKKPRVVTFRGPVIPKRLTIGGVANKSSGEELMRIFYNAASPAEREIGERDDPRVFFNGEPDYEVWKSWMLSTSTDPAVPAYAGISRITPEVLDKVKDLCVRSDLKYWYVECDDKNVVTHFEPGKTYNDKPAGITFE